MLYEYIFTVNNKEFYIETNCTKEILHEVIKDYPKTIKRPSVKGLYRYLKQLGYRVGEMIITDKDDAEDIIELKGWKC